MQSAHLMAAVWCINSCRQFSCQTPECGKPDLSDFGCGRICSSVSITPGIFFYNSLWRMQPRTENIQWAAAHERRRGGDRGQRRVDRLVGADSNVMVTEISALYSCGDSKSLSEWRYVEPWGGWSYNNRRAHRVTLSEMWGWSGHRLEKHKWSVWVSRGLNATFSEWYCWPCSSLYDFL